MVGFVFALSMVASGCQQLDRVFHDSSGAPVVVRQQPMRTVRLAAFTGAADDGSNPATTLASGELVSTQGFTTPQADNSSADADSNGAAQVTAPTGYTAPQFAMVQLITLTGQFGRTDAVADANAAQGALVGGSQGIIGRAGLTAPSATIGTTLVSRPGLQEGLATGLSFATPGRTVFDAQRNPRSGVNGRCTDLAGAGFFGGDRTACERVRRR